MCVQFNIHQTQSFTALYRISVAEPHHFDAAPGKSFDSAPDPVVTLLYTQPTCLKQAKVK
jgi:hypothetical protein